jgi:hypothetical protein
METTKILSQDSLCHGKDSNLAPHEYKSELLPLEPTCLPEY